MVRELSRTNRVPDSLIEVLTLSKVLKALELREQEALKELERRMSAPEKLLTNKSEKWTNKHP